MALSASGLAFAYAAFRLLALFDPVWIWLDGQWMLGWWMALISSLFHRRISARLLCLALGGCQGVSGVRHVHLAHGAGLCAWVVFLFGCARH